MRDLIVTENITLDGVIEATGWFDPAGGEEDLLDVETVLKSSARPPRRFSWGG